MTKFVIGNKIEIPIPSDRVVFWTQRFPDDADLFNGNNLVLMVSSNGYRPIWETASATVQGVERKVVELSCHELEGFVLELAEECNCALVYYALKELEESLKNFESDEYQGIQVNDYCLPEVEDIAANAEFTTRTVSLEVEASRGTDDVGEKRVSFGTRIICNILE